MRVSERELSAMRIQLNAFSSFYIQEVAIFSRLLSDDNSTFF